MLYCKKQNCFVITWFQLRPHSGVMWNPFHRKWINIHHPQDPLSIPGVKCCLFWMATNYLEYIQQSIVNNHNIDKFHNNHLDLIRENYHNSLARVCGFCKNNGLWCRSVGFSCYGNMGAKFISSYLNEKYFNFRSNLWYVFLFHFEIWLYKGHISLQKQRPNKTV